MRANEFFYSCIIPFFNSVLEFYLVIVTIKIITAQNMTVKQETLVYQPYYDLAKNSITMLSVIRGVRLRFKFFWIFAWNVRWSVIEETSRPRKRLLFFGSPRQARRIALRTKKPPYGEIRRKKGVCVVAADWGKSAALSAFRRIWKGRIRCGCIQVLVFYFKL